MNLASLEFDPRPSQLSSRVPMPAILTSLSLSAFSFSSRWKLPELYPMIPTEIPHTCTGRVKAVHIAPGELLVALSLYVAVTF
jgi:hypothetical protein